MAYSKTVWNNNTPPDISAENLNKMEQGIYDAQFPDGGSTGQILSKTNDGTGWIDDPNSAEWGNITGQLSEQTDLYSELESKITLPSGGTTGQVLTKTASGQAWDDVDGLPSGGTAGQVLTKNSSTSGDASWQDVDGLPAGGTAGQVLTKQSITDGDADWETPTGGQWGQITGTLSNQTDLVAALDAKANASNLATIESSTTASQAYSTGDHLVLNGQLYEVTTAINSGETLTVGTNISATTVGTELTALNNSLTWKRIIDVQTTTNVSYDQTLSVEDLSSYNEIMFTLQRTSNRRTFATAMCPITQFQNAALYASGSYSLYSGVISQNPSRWINAVAIWSSNTGIEIACNANDEPLTLRVSVR